jgi:hypothetical protein
MKPPWIWIIGFFFVIWLLLDDKKKTYSPSSYESYQSPSSPTRPLYIPPSNFDGYPCISDCSGHEAGYDWAEENGIDDPDDCMGRSQSFIEGCQTYAEEQ